jgi:lipopolysaccharide biosynthesis glycosyltransferase
MILKPFNVYIGYDRREDTAAEICKYSIVRRTKPIDITFLKLEEIPELVRPREEKQSTDFTYSRFMIPYLEEYHGFSLFCDCDFLFLDDVRELSRMIDPTKAVSVVKHPMYIPNTLEKMDGVEQHTMPRKNWASLIMFNNSHPSNKKLTPELINTVQPGKVLHQFGWLDDSEIGSISLDWNVLDGYYELDNPRAIHFTDGGPWFANYRNTHYTPFWLSEQTHYEYTRRLACNI